MSTEPEPDKPLPTIDRPAFSYPLADFTEPNRTALRACEWCGVRLLAGEDRHCGECLEGACD